METRPFEGSCELIGVAAKNEADDEADDASLIVGSICSTMLEEEALIDDVKSEGFGVDLKKKSSSSSSDSSKIVLTNRRQQVVGECDAARRSDFDGGRSHWS